MLITSFCSSIVGLVLIVIQMPKDSKHKACEMMRW